MKEVEVKKSGWKRLIISIVGIAVMIAGCAKPDDGQSSGGAIKVTTTIGMITDAVQNVGGEHVAVTGLMGEGVDPHVYKAKQGDVRRLEKADIIFYNGLYLEAQMGEVLRKMDGKKKTVAVGESLDESQLLVGDPNGVGAYDPHIWFDVTNWMRVVETIRDELKALDPKHADNYDRNAEAYLEQLSELHQYALEQISSIPKERRVLVTAHDAFGYFGRAYDIEVLGLQGISTAAETGLKDVSDLRDYMIEHGIRAIFSETSVNDKSVKAVIEGAKREGFEIVLGGELFSDAMGPEGAVEGTYIGMVRHNVDMIVQALK